MIYPSENVWIAKKIIETGGAIISEYPLGMKPEKMNFPARNRIISGMSKGIIVVEAKEWNTYNCGFCIRTGKRCLCGSGKY